MTNDTGPNDASAMALTASSWVRDHIASLLVDKMLVTANSIEVAVTDMESRDPDVRHYAIALYLTAALQEATDYLLAAHGGDRARALEALQKRHIDATITQLGDTLVDDPEEP
ncbi:hypothetical protein [Agrococcus jejuensis]|uniref:Uncharacterized protein n=1 Tax=Agrococcus jejuensis TaxID=399736 RepID=A0A1G8F081_9MICO|nr:hypothetical protein [Agrococcus jejuensis]SDH75507.1 hypothetical protein SAMN04489720_2266 [Agrococcus jejuensis]